MSGQRVAFAIVAVAVVLFGALAFGLYGEVADRLERAGESTHGLPQFFALLAAGTCLLLVALVLSLVRQGLAPLDRATAELARLQSRLGNALEREKEFTGHVAHELRTPLTVLRTGLELTLRKQASSSDAYAQLVELLSTVDEMQRLVDNLLLLARVERGAETTQLQAVAVRPLVDAVWKRFADKAAGRQLSFENRILDEHCVQADRGKLQIVIQNLLANAVSYTETGGSIVVESTEHALLSVWDSGPQLADEALARVFDRLWRADLARTDATQHAGLGLSLARALCRLMAMDLVAQNVATGGLRFALVRHEAPARESAV